MHRKALPRGKPQEGVSTVSIGTCVCMIKPHASGNNTFLLHEPVLHFSVSRATMPTEPHSSQQVLFQAVSFWLSGCLTETCTQGESSTWADSTWADSFQHCIQFG